MKGDSNEKHQSCVADYRFYYGAFACDQFHQILQPPPEPDPPEVVPDDTTPPAIIEGGSVQNGKKDVNPDFLNTEGITI